MEPDPKRIARDWNREIEAEIRRLAEKDNGGWGRSLVWALLTMAWLLLVLACFGVLPRP
jgi:hypothetical protein